MDPSTKMGYPCSGPSTGIYLSGLANEHFEDLEEMKRALAAAFGLRLTEWEEIPDTCPVEFFERDVEYALFIRSTVISWDWNRFKNNLRRKPRKRG